jgi:uncharacterized membrane protein
MCLERFTKKIYEMHKSPTNCVLHIIAIVVVIYALWINSLVLVLVGILIGVIGHIIEEVGKKGKRKVKKKKRRKK